MRSRAALDLLRTYESRNVTCLAPDGSWPIVWERARGVEVWDADGKKYIDLTAAFGVAAAGHANPRVVRAGQRQMARLLHAMGDVHPHRLKGELARELSRITFERWTAASVVANPKPETRNPKPEIHAPAVAGKTLFCNSGFEAVEAALKTALLVTAKPGVIAFTGAYHGLGYGALATTHRAFFRAPFQSQLGRFGHFVPFPHDTRSEAENRRSLEATEDAIRRLLRKKPIGTILVEPVQGRGGINVPPLQFLPMLRRLCDEHHALLVLDEIYTGFGRTGRWFACEHSGVVPDLICLGKALTGGFPLSACVGRAVYMDAWPPSAGEALHTSTFLGHPVGCAMALAHIREIETRNLVARSAILGGVLLQALRRLPVPPAFRFSARGLGLMAGLEIRHPDGAPATEAIMTIVQSMLHQGFILLPEGPHGEVLSFTPPLTISRQHLEQAVRLVARITANPEFP